MNNTALNVVKVLLSPTNQPAAVGTNLIFRITFQNVGNTVITSLPFEDNFSGAYYSVYVASTPFPPPAAGSGTYRSGRISPAQVSRPTPLSPTMSP